MKDKLEKATNGSMIRVLFTAVAAVAMLALPFRLAVLVFAVWIIWAICELVVLAHELRVDRRRHEIRQLIERELASVPTGAPIPAPFPRAWRPFIGDRRALSVSRHASR